MTRFLAILCLCLAALLAQALFTHATNVAQITAEQAAERGKY